MDQHKKLAMLILGERKKPEPDLMGGSEDDDSSGVDLADLMEELGQALAHEDWEGAARAFKEAAEMSGNTESDDSEGE